VCALLPHTATQCSQLVHTRFKELDVLAEVLLKAAKVAYKENDYNFAAYSSHQKNNAPARTSKRKSITNKYHSPRPKRRQRHTHTLTHTHTHTHTQTHTPYLVAAECLLVLLEPLGARQQSHLRRKEMGEVFQAEENSWFSFCLLSCSPLLIEIHIVSENRRCLSRESEFVSLDNRGGVTRKERACVVFECR
jgi:hypothetical protein